MTNSKKEELKKEFEQTILEYPYSDTEELNDEHEHIFKWSISKFDQLIKEKVDKIEELQKYTGGSSVEPKDVRVKLVDVLTILKE